MSELSPQRRFRASDADRDGVLQILQQAHAAGRLELAELDERQTKALQAKYLDEFPGLIGDLPEGGAMAPRRHPAVPHPGLPPVGVSSGAMTYTIMSGKKFVVAPGTPVIRNLAFWGGDDIDVTEVMGPGVVLLLDLPAVMGGHTVRVPPGVRVVDESMAIMAGNDVARDAGGDGSNGTLILRGFLFWAGHTVKLDKRFRRR